MMKKEPLWWIAGVGTIFLVSVLLHVLRVEGGLRYYLYQLDGVEVAATIVDAAIRTFGVIWHGSVLVGLVFVLVMLLVLSRAGRLRRQIPTLALWAAVVALPLLVRSAQAAFETIDPELEKVGLTLGRSPLAVFFTITLPLVSDRIPSLGV